MNRFTVTSEETGTRLDVILTARLGVSRSRIQKLIKEGAVTQNGTAAIAHKLAFEGDVIGSPAASDLVEKKPKKKLPELNIVFEDKDVLVINKPAGLLVHANNANEPKPTVAEMAVKHDKKIAKVGENELRPGIVHRLDKDVSGLMVIAKTAKAFESLKGQFMRHETEKHYIALAYGKMPKDHDVITLKIARSKNRGRMVARPDSQEGKEAITEYTVIERLKTASLIDVRTRTGRTHQIRTHLFAINHPLVGDTLYRKSRGGLLRHIRQVELGRVFLHASQLGFELPDGTSLKFEAPLPNELTDYLAAQPRL